VRLKQFFFYFCWAGTNGFKFASERESSAETQADSVVVNLSNGSLATAAQSVGALPADSEFGHGLTESGWQHVTGRAPDKKPEFRARFSFL
jgi:hypothetical protein